MKRIQFAIPQNLDFNIVKFDPTTVFGQGWKFAPEINGLVDNDGITAFQTAIVKAASLPKDEGRMLLFPTGLPEGETTIIGEDKIKALTNQPLADTDLLWSLYKEEGQKTLRYLHDTYGVTWMEALRRIILDTHGNRYTLSLNRFGGGSWNRHYYFLKYDRSAVNPALSFEI